MLSRLSSKIEAMWYEKGKGYWPLLPLAWLYGLISATRRLLFRLGIKKAYKVKAPVIVVGNISVGGTGKTPFTLLLCKLLQEKGFKPGIVSRGYGAKITHPVLVSLDAKAQDVGDEPLLLAKRSLCPVVVCPNRVAAAEFLLANTDCDVLISDDGLQHYRLARDIEIILVDGTRGLGNGQLLPAGPLREKAWRLKTANLVIANSGVFDAADGVMTLVPSKARSLVSNDVLAPCEVTLVAGIGNPQRFENTATSAGFSVNARYYFADHHQFTPSDFSHVDGAILMTEKDAVKCHPFAQDNWYSLGVDACLEPSLLKKLDNIITTLRSNYGT